MTLFKVITKLNDLQKRRAELIRKHKEELKELDAEIAKEKTTLEKLEKALEPYVCKACNGERTESYTDAAGGKDWRECSACLGTGVITEIG